MIPTSFEEENVVLNPPENLDCECINALQTHTEAGLPVIITCWKVTKEELDEITITGRIWLVICGNTMPPVQLTSEKSIVKNK